MRIASSCRGLTTNTYNLIGSGFSDFLEVHYDVQCLYYKENLNVVQTHKI